MSDFVILEEVASVPARLSRWIDESPANINRDREALMWHRVMKVAEEAGEVNEAMIGYTGGNPRKGQTHSIEDIVKELLDVAVSGLSGVEHLTGNRGRSLPLLLEHLTFLANRAGLDEIDAARRWQNGPAGKPQGQELDELKHRIELRD